MKLNQIMGQEEINEQEIMMMTMMMIMMKKEFKKQKEKIKRHNQTEETKQRQTRGQDNKQETIIKVMMMMKEYKIQEKIKEHNQIEGTKQIKGQEDNKLKKKIRECLQEGKKQGQLHLQVFGSLNMKKSVINVVKMLLSKIKQLN